MGIKDFLLKIVQEAVNETITKEMHNRMDRLERRIDDLEKKFEVRFDNLEKRFEVRFDNIEKGLATVQGNLEGEAQFFHLIEYLKKQQAT